MNGAVTFLVVFASSSVALWRLRIGLRVRAAAGVAASPIARASQDLGITALVCVAIGATLFGLQGAWLGVLMSFPAAWARGLRAQATTSDQLERQVPGLMRGIAAGVRSGLGLRSSIEAAAHDSQSPLVEVLEGVIAEMRAGVSVDAALASSSLPSNSKDNIVETLRIVSKGGDGSAAALELIAEGLEDSARLNLERRAAATQGRLSAVVVGAMPLAFTLLTASSVNSPAKILISEPVGWVMLAAGVVLEAIGVLWVRKAMS